ncbi:hypothetical protein [Rhodoferax sp.]|uniref:hypothetical protein n=1 Tax=Rhodoferax sp. TaxID=50421 RepID=UPI00271C4FC1|nr:hypothetical protein [Rhodoferax sp.]MDO9195921.1 hypothetical protein [Rhodoferax sp.]
MSIRFNAQVRAILQEAATELGALGYYARIEPGHMPESAEGVFTLNVASSLEGLARAEELLALGQAQFKSQTSKLALLKFIARSQDRSMDPDFLTGVAGPIPK